MSRDEEVPPRKQRRRGRKRLAALLVLSGLLIWLNGPGWRLIGGIGLRHALEQAGLAADFELKGTLLGGIRVERLSLSGGPIRKLTIGSLGPLYQLRRAIRGEIDGVAVERVDVVVDLAGPPLPTSSKRDERSEPEDLPTTLRKIRALVLPMELSAADLRFQLVRGEESLLILDSSDFSHAPGSGAFRLNLGTLAAGPGSGSEFPAQETVIHWSEELLTLDRFHLNPRVGVADVRIEMPAGGELAASAVAQVEDSRLVLNGTLSSASVRLEGGPLVVQEAVRNFAVGLPVEATVRSLEATIRGFNRTPDQWQATARAEIGGVRFEDWRAESILLDASKDLNTGGLAWSVAALDGELKGQADLVWRDLAAGDWTDFQATAKASVPRLDPIFAALNSKLAFAPAGASPLPASSLTLDADIDSARDGIRSVAARWLVSADETKRSPGASPAASLAGENRWIPDGKLTGTFGTDSLRAKYSLDLTAKRYDAEATLDGFRPESLAAWAGATGIELPAGMTASLDWQGSGEFAPQPHRGTFDVTTFEWARKDAAPLIARSQGSYNWPGEVTLTDFTAVTAGQSIRARATLADMLLKIPSIEWKDGETRLVSGRAEIPVPANSAGIRDFLKQEIPLNVFLESEWIDAGRLAAWMPGDKPPFSEGSGRVHLVITGTPAAPRIDFEASLKGLRLPDRPDVPATDAVITLDGADGSLALAGELRPASFPPVTLSGKMPFRPGEWAENPGMVLEERFEARSNIPNLDLAGFRSFIPNADVLAGSVEGFFTATGTLGKPELAGELRLAGGAFSLKDSPAPPVSNANLLVRLRGKDVRLESLSLESSGGTLTGSGTLGLADTTKPTLDFSVRGTALPLKRDDSMIVRADTNLALRGDLEQATLSGTVDLVDSLFYRDFELLPVRVPFTAPSRPSLPSIDPDEKAADFPAPFGNWALDVRVRTRDPLLIRGNLARGSAVADIRFGGTLGNIQPQGNAIVRDVTARLPFSTLTVNNGTIAFTPAGGLNPELNIRGTSTIGRFEVNLFFYGPVNAPKTALTSHPPLPESEIMTLLATGTTSDGLSDGQAATMKAALLFIEEWRRGRLPFGEQLAKLVAVLNNVDIRVGEDDPLTGRRLNSATIQITDRIFISGSVDKQSNTRVLGAFVLRFK